jgi:hypothetical protein
MEKGTTHGSEPLDLAEAGAYEAEITDFWRERGEGPIYERRAAFGSGWNKPIDGPTKSGGNLVRTHFESAIHAQGTPRSAFYQKSAQTWPPMAVKHTSAKNQLNT